MRKSEVKVLISGIEVLLLLPGVLLKPLGRKILMVKKSRHYENDTNGQKEKEMINFYHQTTGETIPVHPDDFAKYLMLSNPFNEHEPA